MSALTKLFVVLLVICSLLVSASVIVFVNRVEDFRAAARNSDDLYKSEKTARESAEATLRSAIASKDEQTKSYNGRLGELDTQLKSDEGKIADQAVQIAAGNNKNAVSEADIAHMTEALKAAEDQNKADGTLIADVRTKNDELVKRNVDLSNGFTESSSKAEAERKQIEFLEEQLSDSRRQNDDYLRVIKENHLDANASHTASSVSLVPIRGTVKEVNRIGGNMYATISVGTSANVAKGMEFNAIDPASGEFLGIVHIDSVDTDESIGQLKGPHVEAIKQGTEVRTQLP